MDHNGCQVSFEPIRMAIIGVARKVQLLHDEKAAGRGEVAAPQQLETASVEAHAPTDNVRKEPRPKSRDGARGASVDVMSAAQRSRTMSRVRAQHTKPELAVRRLLFAEGYRYRLHRKDLPGSPDIVFPSRKKVVFVHGCFWHRHQSCRLATTPKSRAEFWSRKFSANIERDNRNHAELIRLGWEVRIVWQCELNDAATLRQQLRLFLGPP